MTLSHWIPSPPLALGLFLLGALWSAVLGWTCGFLKLRRGIATNYTRKIFHFGIFTAAMGIHLGWQFPGVNAYAVGVVLIVVYGLWCGTGYPIFEGIARERDEPHRAFYVWVPMATTALGGLVSNLAVADAAVVGYLVTGWGDAIGEPIGRWIGRHPYRVPTLRKVSCTRTLEGSAAVGVASFLAALVALMLAFHMPFPAAAWRSLVIALVAMTVEAFSPHGSDNFTVMVAASLMAAFLIS